MTPKYSVLVYSHFSSDVARWANLPRTVLFLFLAYVLQLDRDDTLLLRDKSQSLLGLTSPQLRFRFAAIGVQFSTIFAVTFYV